MTTETGWRSAGRPIRKSWSKTGMAVLLLWCVGLVFVPNALAETAPDVQWTRLLGSAADDIGYGIAVDGTGNSYVVGHTYGNLDGNISSGDYDVFIAKYDNNGNKLWTKLLGTTYSDEGYGIAVDNAGNSYITGQAQGNLDWNMNAGTADIFIAKYDTNGNKQWTKLLGTSSGDVGYDIAVDIVGNSYVTGITYGNLDGNANTGGYDIFIAKYDTNGNKQWTKLLGTYSYDWGYGIAVDSYGNSYITGMTSGNLDGNTNAGYYDIFIAKYDTNGNKQWTKLLGTSYNDPDVGYDIAVDGSGNSYVTGYTVGSLDGNANMGVNDMLVAKYNTNGNKQWTKLLGTSSNDYGQSITADSSGNSYVTGYTNGNLDGNTNAGNGSSDIFVSKYDTNGNKQWTKLMGTSSQEISWGIAVDSSGRGCP